MAAVLQYPVRHPEWRLAYAGKTITSAITGMVIEITYTDVYHGRIGDVEIKLEDRDKKWQGPWFPVQGDLLELIIGYAGEPKLDCGHGQPFQVDEVELEGPPDVFTIRAIPGWIDTHLRTPTSFAYENQTLLQVAAGVAAKHGMTVAGVPNDVNVTFARVTQNHETDLAFLHRLANENDYDFTVHGKIISFFSRTFLNRQPPVLTIQRTGVEKFHFKSMANLIYVDSTVSYQDPTTGKLITGSATATPMSPPVPTRDTLNIVRRTENPVDANQKAAAALRLQNMVFGTGNLTVPGNVGLLSMLNVNVSGFGKYDSTYIIIQARHRLSRDTGYTTELELQKTPN